MAQKERFQVNERREVGNRTGERVILQAKDSELVEAGESVRRECATKRETLEDEADDAALGALDALPLAVVEALIDEIEKLVVQVGLGLERKKRNGIGWEEVACGLRKRRRSRTGDDEEEKEEKHGNGVRRETEKVAVVLWSAEQLAL